MLSISSAHRIWLCTLPTDMRSSFDGLSAMVGLHLQENPTSGDWFVFINRRRTQIKVLAFESGGYALWSKRLEMGRFAALGQADEAKRMLSQTALQALLEGVDIVVKRQRKRYQRAA